MNKNFIELAKTQAQNVEHVAPRRSGWYRHGAVLFRKKHILNTGYNKKGKTSPQSLNKYKNLHAEHDCLLGIPKDQIVGASILVIRLSALNTLTNSKPCEFCQRLMKLSGIRDVFYSDYEGRIIKERL